MNLSPVFDHGQLIEETLREMYLDDVLFRPFTASAPVRWDAIAYAFWSTPWIYELVLRANPVMMRQPYLKGGETVWLPQIEQRPWVDPNSLPPWDKRRQQWRR